MPEANGAEENRDVGNRPPSAPPMMPAQGAQGGGGASSRGRENRSRDRRKWTLELRSAVAKMRISHPAARVPQSRCLIFLRALSPK
eukprot:scaffold60490_cov32-Phaeocystis_antarctica.AAC.1